MSGPPKPKEDRGGWSSSNSQWSGADPMVGMNRGGEMTGGPSGGWGPPPASKPPAGWAGQPGAPRAPVGPGQWDGDSPTMPRRPMPSNFDDIRDGTNIWGNKAGGGQPGGPGGPGNGGECFSYLSPRLRNRVYLYYSYSYRLII